MRERESVLDFNERERELVLDFNERESQSWILTRERGKDRERELVSHGF